MWQHTLDRLNIEDRLHCCHAFLDASRRSGRCSSSAIGTHLNAAATLHGRTDAAESCATVAAASNLLLAMRTGEGCHFAEVSVSCAIAKLNMEVSTAAVRRKQLINVKEYDWRDQSGIGQCLTGLTSYTPNCHTQRRPLWVKTVHTVVLNVLVYVTLTSSNALVVADR